MGRSTKEHKPVAKPYPFYNTAEYERKLIDYPLGGIIGITSGLIVRMKMLEKRVWKLEQLQKEE